MDKHSWMEKFLSNINREKQNFSEKDYRFFHVDRMIKIARHINSLSSSCAECLNLKSHVLELSDGLGKYINGSTRDRIYFERIFENAVSHLRKVHGFYPPFHYNYLYTFLGFIFGAVSGALIHFSFPGIFGMKMIFILSLLGLFSGQIAGRKKDIQVRKEGRKL